MRYLEQLLHLIETVGSAHPRVDRAMLAIERHHSLPAISEVQISKPVITIQVARGRWFSVEFPCCFYIYLEVMKPFLPESMKSYSCSLFNWITPVFSFNFIYHKTCSIAERHPWPISGYSRGYVVTSVGTNQTWVRTLPPPVKFATRQHLVGFSSFLKTMYTVIFVMKGVKKNEIT